MNSNAKKADSVTNPTTTILDDNGTPRNEQSRASRDIASDILRPKKGRTPRPPRRAPEPEVKREPSALDLLVQQLVGRSATASQEKADVESPAEKQPAQETQRKAAPPRKPRSDQRELPLLSVVAGGATDELLPSTQKQLAKLEAQLERSAASRAVKIAAGAEPAIASVADLANLSKTAPGLPYTDHGFDFSKLSLGVWQEEDLTTQSMNIIPAGEAAVMVRSAVGRFMAQHFETTKAEHQGLYGYDGKIWRPFSNVRNVVAEYTDLYVTGDARWINTMVASLRDRLQPLGEPLEGAVPFDNGVLLTQGAQAGVMVPHSPDMWLRSTNGITWNGEQETPVFDSWLDWITEGDEAMRQALLVMFWQTLTGNPYMKAFYEITGASNTGKSVVSNMCILLAGGEQNVMALDMDTLSDMTGAGRFALGDLPGKRLIMMSEQASGRFRTSRLKAMTGGDAVRIEIKNGGSFSWVNRAPIVITNNQAMVFKEDNANHAIFNRRVLIAVNRVVPKDKRDPQLIEKLRAELGGIAFKLLRDFDQRTATAAIDHWRNTSTALDQVLVESDPDARFASMLEPVELQPHNRKLLGSLIWRVGKRPSDEDLRKGAVVSDPAVGLYPLYVHYRKMTGDAAGTLSNRKFAATMLAHLEMLHRHEDMPAAYFKNLPEVLYARQNGLWWRPSDDLISQLTESEAEKPSDADDLSLE